MVDKEKIAQEFAEAAKSMDKSVDTDIDSQERSKREAELHQWNEEQARKVAGEDGIELTDAHLQVVYSLRDYYRVYGVAESARILSDMLATEFASKGGRKYLHSLFPQGPVKQGLRFAGLPVPAHIQDGGFGTAR